MGNFHGTESLGVLIAWPMRWRTVRFRQTHLSVILATIPAAVIRRTYLSEPAQKTRRIWFARAALKVHLENQTGTLALLRMMSD